MRRAEARVAGEGVTVAGVDEAGRGPLAGPVVAAAVVLADGEHWDGLNDSKQMDPATRETVFALTPARWATSRMVAIELPLSSRPVSGQYVTDVRPDGRIF